MAQLWVSLLGVAMGAYLWALSGVLGFGLVIAILVPMQWWLMDRFDMGGFKRERAAYAAETERLIAKWNAERKEQKAAE